MLHPASEPDLRRAALSRAAELSMVAYDSNAAGSQILQGWLMNDNFLLRGTFGAPYEFFWANPYQPGLSYYHAPCSCTTTSSAACSPAPIGTSPPPGLAFSMASCRCSRMVRRPCSIPTPPPSRCRYLQP